MYFESLRSSDEGMLAVGTTVMNRLDSRGYPKTVCGVVGQPRAYAPGVLSKPVGGKSWARALRVADEVLSGARHEQVGKAQFFHTVGWTPPFNNMRYVAVAGGNAFYEKVAPQYRTFVPSGSYEQPPSGFQPRHIELAPVSVAARTLPEPARPAVVARRSTPANIDDLLASTGEGGGSRVNLARLAPMQIHPSAD